MKGLSIGNKRIGRFYRHFIMTLNVDCFNVLFTQQMAYKKICEDDFPILAKGDFALANMKKYLSKEPQKAEGYLFYINNNPVGYLWIVKKGGAELSYKIKSYDIFLSCVCVFKEYRGKGIVNGMIGQIVNIAREAELKTIGLGVNIDNCSAIAAYKKAGFVINGERKYLRFLRKNIPYWEV